MVIEGWREINLKRCIYILLTVLLVLVSTTILAKNVYAAKGVLYPDSCFDRYTDTVHTEPMITLEKGTKLNMSAYLFYGSGLQDEDVRLDHVSGEKYSVNNKEICSVTQKGKLTAKFCGDAIVTIKYKGKKRKIKVRVVEKSLTIRDDIKKVNKVLSQCCKGVKSKDSFQESNRLEKLKQYLSFCECVDRLEKDETEYYPYYHGFFGGVYYGVCVTPDYYKIKDMKEWISDYVRELSKTVSFNVKGVTASYERVIINLAEPVSSDAVYCQYWINAASMEEIGSGTKAIIRMDLERNDDESTDCYLRGYLKTGSKKIVMRPYKTNHDGVDKQTKLRKGTWRFGYTDEEDPEYEWLKDFAKFSID